MIKEKDLKKAERFIKQADKIKIDIGLKRDKLRDIIDDMEAVFESIEDSLEDMDIGTQYLKSGVDELSGYL